MPAVASAPAPPSAPAARRRSVRRTLALAAATVAVAATLLVAFTPARADAATRLAWRGTGAWIDMFDDGSYADPEAAVANLDAHAVDTLYLETSNATWPTAINRPARTSRFIEAAHARGIRIVSWYLPNLTDTSRDRRRSLAAIRYRSVHGQRFDAFALDIESPAVADPALRSRRLVAVSADLRRAVGPNYPLGAIIPSPLGMQLSPSYWPGFPYRALAQHYGVFLPMVYSSYRVHGAEEVFTYTARSVRILRRETGRPGVPIHLIGGLAEDLDAAEVTAFVDAARSFGVLGAGIYDANTTSAAQWTALAGIRVNPEQAVPMPITLGPEQVALRELGNVVGSDRTHPNAVTFAVPGAPGGFRLDLEAWDLQAGECALLVNGRRRQGLAATPAGTWTPVTGLLIPDARLRDDGTNYITIEASGMWPAWSRWGVRRATLHAAP